MPLGKILLISVLFFTGFATIAVSVTMMLSETPRNAEPSGIFVTDADSHGDAQAESAEISVTTTEPLRDVQTDPINDAQMEFNAGRFIESLEILMDFQPKEAGQNRPQYKAFYKVYGLDQYGINFFGDDDVTNNPEENEFYLKDELLTRLLDVFLKSKQSPLAVVAARHIGQYNVRNGALSRIVEAQLNAAKPWSMDVDELDAMLDKAVETASFLDRPDNQIYRSISDKMVMAGRFSSAVKFAERITDRQLRNFLLAGLISWWKVTSTPPRDTVLDETTLQAIIERIDDPAIKCEAFYSLALLHFPADQSCRVRIFENSPQKSGKNLDAVVSTFKTIEIPNNKELTRLLIPAAAHYRRLELEEKAETVEELILTHVPSLTNLRDKYEIYRRLLSHTRQNPVPPAALQEKNDRLIRLAFGVTLEMHADNQYSYLISLLGRHPSRELFHEIDASLLALELTVDEMMKLTDLYVDRYLRPEFSQQELFDGFKNRLMPLAADIYSHSKSGKSEQNRCISHLVRCLLFFPINNRTDEMIELMDFPDVLRPIFDDVMFQVAQRYIVHHSRLNDVEMIESVFLPRITDTTMKTQLRSVLLRRFGTIIGDRMNWDDYFKSAQSEPDENKRLHNYWLILNNYVPDGKDITPFLEELKRKAQGKDGVGFHIGRSISLLRLTYWRNFMSEEEQTQLQQNIERAIEQITSPEEKHRMQLSLTIVLCGRTPLLEESVQLEYFTRLLELARAIPAQTPAERLEAYTETAECALNLRMFEFAGKAADEGLAFDETLPDQNRQRQPGRTPAERLREIKKHLNEK